LNLDSNFVLIPEDKYDENPSCGYDIALIGISMYNLEKINEFI